MPQPCPEAPVRPRGRGRDAAALGALLAALLAVALACAPPPGPGAGHPDVAGVDFAVRHAEMLDAVVDRPERLRAQRAERLRRETLRNRESWEAIEARKSTYWEELAARRRVANEAFERILERQRRHLQQREEIRLRRWSEFLERRADLEP